VNFLAMGVIYDSKDCVCFFVITVKLSRMCRSSIVCYEMGCLWGATSCKHLPTFV